MCAYEPDLRFCICIVFSPPLHDCTQLTICWLKSSVTLTVELQQRAMVFFSENIPQIPKITQTLLTWQTGPHNHLQWLSFKNHHTNTENHPSPFSRRRRIGKSADLASISASFIYYGSESASCVCLFSRICMSTRSPLVYCVSWSLWVQCQCPMSMFDVGHVFPWAYSPRVPALASVHRSDRMSRVCENTLL